MFNDIETAIETVMSRRNKTYGIERFKEALASLGNPQDKLRCIHIGGTNGKGSTTNMVRTILQEAGYKVGSFTSPHLVVHNDRIRVNNIQIDDETFLRYINQSLPLWDEYELSMFEIDMLISIWYFLDERVDYVVYEVGLGGRLDATNVITPLVSAITNVGFDHQGILGNTLTEIATEKSYIIKENVPFFTMIDHKEPLEVVLNRAISMNSEYRQMCIPMYHLKDKTYYFDHENIEFEITNQGSYQVANASLAVSIVKHLLPGLKIEVFQKAIKEASWAGRFEEVIPGVYIDGAHNEMGIARLVESMQILPKPWTVIFTALKDKDYSPMLSELERAFDTVIVTEFDFYRAASAQELARNHRVEVITDYHEAIRKGLELKQEGTLVITGSLYFISEVREYMKKGISNCEPLPVK